MSRINRLCLGALDIPHPIKIPVVWFVDDLSAGVEAKDVVSDR